MSVAEQETLSQRALLSRRKLIDVGYILARLGQECPSYGNRIAGRKSSDECSC